jgi:nucleotide-binding universal stress UspA family protein
MDMNQWIARWEDEGGAVPEVKAGRKRGAGKARPAITLGQILAPIDFSPESLKTLRFAKLLATQTGARLHLLHVVTLPVISTARPVTIPPAFSEEAIATRARQRMKELLAELSLPAGSNPATVRSGAPTEEINEAARTTDADLIAMATRGYTGLKRAFLGSTTERVVRQAPCPVLVVREKEDQPTKKSARRTALQFRKILVPIDFSECSRLGLGYALGFAEDFGARLVLFHSVFVPAYVLGDEYTAREVPDLIATQQDYAKDEMEKLRQSVSRKGREVESEVAFGPPVEQITDYAANEEVDLIITSTHGRSGLRRVFIGSTAEQIVRHAPCSVLVVPNRSSSKKAKQSK